MTDAQPEKQGALDCPRKEVCRYGVSSLLKPHWPLVAALNPVSLSLRAEPLRSLCLHFLAFEDLSLCMEFSTATVTASS
jgi:hypothetical protein